MTVVVRGHKGRTKKAAGAVLAAAFLAGGAVGCSSDSGKKDVGSDISPAAAVKQAAKKSDELKSFSFRMKGEVPGDGRVQGEASMSTDPLAMQMKVAAPVEGTTKKAEIRLVDNVMYLGGGKEAAAQMDGKSWIKLDMSALKAGGKGFPSSLDGQANKNPAAESALLSGSEDVEKVGTETVDGVKTTHYKGTVTLDEMRKSLKGEDAATKKRREKSLKQYEDMGIDKLTMDMWIDTEEHAKQFRVRGKGDKGPMDMTITFLDYNKPVTIKAPPKSQVMDFAEEMKKARG